MHAPLARAPDDHRAERLGTADDVHVQVLHGRDPHHITEAQFKAVARALREAIAPDPRVTGVPSTKGVL